MRARSLSSILLVLLATACVATPRATAEPRRPGEGAASESPLVRYAVESDADAARAIREYYTKFEVRVPMRDGARLFTTYYVPKDASRTWPILMMRTPYSVRPYGVDAYPTTSEPRVLRRFAPSYAFVREGYVFVHQDVRGKNMSEGTFVDVRPRAQKSGEIDESTDAWDTIDWLVKNVPSNNGRVGVWGISYPGFYAAQAAIEAHPALKAVSPQAPVTDWYMGDDFHHNGAFFLADSFDFEAAFGKARPKPVKPSAANRWEGVAHDVSDVYDFFLAMGPLSNANAKYLEGKIAFWNEMMAHPNRDAYWLARDPRPHYKDAKPAIMTVGGWYDAEDPWGPLWTYGAYEKQRPRNENVLVMGPWKHGGWARTDGDRLGDVTFGQKTSLHYREGLELPFFRRHLKGAKGAPLPEATVFETGTNTWRSYDAWPPRNARTATFYFGAGGRLVTTPPSETGADVFPSDPRKPVPYRGKPSAELDHDWVTDDQRFASRRPDVLVYTSEELTEDVTVTGALEARVWLATTGTDADVIVKLVDVHPEDAPDGEGATPTKMGGYQQLVRGEVMRARFRDGFESPKAMTPNEPALVRFALPDVAHAFRAGHRIMVQVQSSWFPLVDRNPQTFVPSIYEAKPEDFRAETHRVVRSAVMPSSIQVTLTAGALPSAAKR